MAAQAGRRVVVLTFSGPQGESAEKAVQTIVGQDNSLVPAAAFAKAQRQLKIGSMTERNVARVAKKVQADALVLGAVRRKGIKWSLHLTVREGKTGDTVDIIVVPLRTPRIDDHARESIVQQLLPAIARVSTIEDEPVRAAPEVVTERRRDPPPERVREESRPADEPRDDRSGDRYAPARDDRRADDLS